MSRLSRYARPFKLPLSPPQIRRALRLGTGRLYLHKELYGLEEHSEDLYAACLRNMVYDTQCEASRSKWLLGLLTPAQETELIERLLVAAPKSRRHKDLRQHRELALGLFKKGHLKAKRILYAAFRLNQDWLPIAAEEILIVDGALGLTRIFAWVMEIARSEYWEYLTEALVRAYNVQYGKGQAEAVLADTPEYARFLSFQETEPEAELESPFHLEMPIVDNSVAAFLKMVDASENSYFSHPDLSWWQKSATDAQLRELASYLTTDTTLNRMGYILSVFCRRELPDLEEHLDTLFDLAKHENWHVKYRSHQVMARNFHPKIRALALENLRQRTWLTGELSPLKTNLVAGDSKHFDEALWVDRNDYRHHRLVGDLLDICQSKPWPELLEVMHFVYETSPCTSCRYWMYEVMKKQGLLPDWIEREWVYDVQALDYDWED